METRLYRPTNIESKQIKSDFSKHTKGEDSVSSDASTGEEEQQQQQQLDGPAENDNDYPVIDPGTGEKKSHETTLSKSEHSFKEQQQGKQVRKSLRRLSVPPTIRLVPRSSSSGSLSPSKSMPESDSTVTATTSIASSSDTVSASEEAVNAGSAQGETLSTISAAAEAPEGDVVGRSDRSIKNTRGGLDVERGLALRKPSPMRATGASLDSTSPSSKRKAGGGRFLLSVLDSALRRKGDGTKGERDDKRGNESMEIEEEDKDGKMVNKYRTVRDSF